MLCIKLYLDKKFLNNILFKKKMQVLCDTDGYLSKGMDFTLEGLFQVLIYVPSNICELASGLLAPPRGLDKLLVVINCLKSGHKCPL